MDRRQLLLAGGGALAALPLAAGASPRSEGLRVLDTYIASRDRFPATPAPQPGDRLRLRRDPERRFDPLSIRIETGQGLPLGYLPGQPSRILAVLMDNGAAAEARVAEGGGLSVYLSARA